MIAPFWADLEANIQNEGAGIFMLSNTKELHILYNKMSLYNQDPNHTITFEVIMKAGYLVGGNLVYIYHEVSPELIPTLNRLETKSKPAYVIGVNAGDDINFLQEKQFDRLMYSFDLAFSRP